MTEQVKENKSTMVEEKNMEEEKASMEENEGKAAAETMTEDEKTSVQVDEVTELKQELEIIQNRLLRTQADFENYKKRTRAEKEEINKYVTAKLMESLLPIIDNFGRAVQSSSESQNFDSLIQGVEMVFKQFEEVLTKEGLEPIEAVGQPFNPEFHQAVMQVETEEYDSGIIVEELQKGYKLKEKLIRPSMVKVNA